MGQQPTSSSRTITVVVVTALTVSVVVPCWTVPILGSEYVQTSRARSAAVSARHCGRRLRSNPGKCSPRQRAVCSHALKSVTVNKEHFTACVTLGLDPSTEPSQADIKRAFRREVLKSHPDVGGEGSSARFYAVKTAYEILTGRAITTNSPKAPQTSKEQPMRGGSGPSEEELREVWAEVGYNPYCSEDDFGFQDADQDEWEPFATHTNDDFEPVHSELPQEIKPGHVVVTAVRRRPLRQHTPSKEEQFCITHMFEMFLSQVVLFGTIRYLLQLPSC